MATAAVLLYRDLKFGEYMPGTARVEEYANAGAALRRLSNDGWKVSRINSQVFYKIDACTYVTHECMILY